MSSSTKVRRTGVPPSKGPNPPRVPTLQGLPPSKGPNSPGVTTLQGSQLSKGYHPPRVKPLIFRLLPDDKRNTDSKMTVLYNEIFPVGICETLRSEILP